MFGVVDAASRKLRTRGVNLGIVPQNLYEFWATATRPISANGLGLTISETESELVKIKSAFRLFLDHSSLLSEWESLVAKYNCHGRVSYDARIVAAMNTHSIPEVLTLNGADFARFPMIRAVDPRNV